MSDDYKDGFKRGTHLHHRGRHRVDPLDELMLGLALGNKCAAGEHDETVAEKTQVTYLPDIGQVPPGTRYCLRCGKLLKGDAEIGGEAKWPGPTGPAATPPSSS